MATINAIGTPQITLGGIFTMVGAFSFTGNLTGITNVTFPTSGTLATTTQTFPFNNVTGTTQAAVVNNGYVTSNAGATTVTLPATAAIGDRIAVIGAGAGGWVLTAFAGQTIKLLTATTSSGGTLTSAGQYENVEVICIVANTTWEVRSMMSVGLTYA